MLKFISLANGKRYASPKVQEERVGRWLHQAGFKSSEIRYQPNGSCNSPDWLIKYNFQWVHVECKTSLKSRIDFGDTLPNRTTIYIFSSKKYNDTMLFYGADIYHIQLEKIIKTYKQASKKLIKKYTKQCLACRRNSHGFIPINRLRLQQRGIAASTDFFKHKKTLLSKFRNRYR